MTFEQTYAISKGVVRLMKIIILFKIEATSVERMNRTHETKKKTVNKYHAECRMEEQRLMCCSAGDDEPRQSDSEQMGVNTVVARSRAILMCLSKARHSLGSLDHTRMN